MIERNNFETSDAYELATTLEQPETARINLYVYNAPIFWQTLGNDRVWYPERYLPPGERSYDRPCRGVRVRSAVAGKPARVTLELLADWDL